MTFKAYLLQSGMGDQLSLQRPLPNISGYGRGLFLCQFLPAVVQDTYAFGSLIFGGSLDHLRRPGATFSTFTSLPGTARETPGSYHPSDECDEVAGRRGGVFGESDPVGHLW